MSSELHAAVFDKKHWTGREVVIWLAERKKRVIAMHDHGKTFRATFTPAEHDRQYRTIQLPNHISLVYSFPL